MHIKNIKSLNMVLQKYKMNEILNIVFSIIRKYLQIIKRST